MTYNPTLLARKEVRALLPVWAAAVAAVFLTFGIADPSSPWTGGIFLGIAVYSAGAIALGALSIGHEYLHGTLPALLTVPVRRRTVLLIKLVVTGGMTLSLAGAAWLAGAAAVSPFSVVLPAAGGILLAPFLTMLCRGPLAGSVFTLAVLRRCISPPRYSPQLSTDRRRKRQRLAARSGWLRSH